MSQQSVEAVIGRVILDEEFRRLLHANPNQALAEFELTPLERARIKNIDAETLEALAKTLDSRTTKLHPTKSSMTP